MHGVYSFLCAFSVTISPLTSYFRRKNRSRSVSMQRKDVHENNEKIVNHAVPPSVEAVMEKVVFRTVKFVCEMT